MDAAEAIRTARGRAGLSQQRLAALAQTSQATISAYEAGRKQPSADTLARLVGACGMELTLRPGPRRPDADALATSGRRFAEVLTLAESLPFRRSGPLRYPRLPSAA